MIQAIIFAILGLIISASSVHAAEPPILISPANHSTVTTSKLEWQAPSYPIYTQGSPYLVQIKNTSNFTSQDDRYKTNTYYTPQLSAGTWYWRVKAKNSDGIWSDWSLTWSFNLVIETISPTPSPTPTSTSTPTQTPSSSTSPSSQTSAFTISNVPSQIDSDQSFTLQVNLSLANNPNTKFYLKGAFKKPDNSNYFGLIKVGNDWVKNSSKYSEQYPITTDPSGNWSGTLEIQPDSDDYGFTGSDDYIFKIGRYTSSGSGPTWSNESTIKIIATSTQNTVSETSSKTSGKTSNSPANSNPSPQVAKTNIANSVPSKSSGNIEYHIASVAGAAASESASPSATAEVKSERKNFIPWIGGALILCGLGSLGYIYLRSRKII